MKEFYIAVKMIYAGELYTISGPYDSFEKAEADLDLQKIVWDDSLDEDEYLGIVSHEKKDISSNSTNQNNYCPMCGNRVLAGARFCGNCGHKL